MLPVAILAGGLATRLRPVTETIPKALLPINGRPFLAHQLRLLKQSGIDRAVLCVGYLGEQIREYAGDGGAFGMEILYSFDGESLLGTAGAIRRALPLLGDAFFTLYGDSYLRCDYRSAEEALMRSGKPALMTVFRNEGLWETSNVEFSDGVILAYDKKNRTPRMRHVDYGLGVFRREACKRIPDGRSYDLASLYQGLVKDHALAALEMPERFYEIGSLQGIRDLEAFLCSQADS